MLQELIIDKKITVRVMEPASNTFDPVIDIWFSDEEKKVLKKIFSIMRPGQGWTRSGFFILRSRSRSLKKKFFPIRLSIKS